MPYSTAQSEFGQLKKVYLKNLREAFINQALIDEQWEGLNFLSIPDFEMAVKEYDQFEQILRFNGTEIVYFSKNDSVTMDSLYCRDASIVTDYGVILCNMGKEQRRGEPIACKEDYLEKEISILGEITEGGKIEGGDVAWIDQNTLAVGHGYRTNDEGFRQLEKLLQPFDIKLIQVDLPHYKGVNDVFHLMSIFSPIDKDKAVVYSPLMPVRFRNELLDRGFQLIEVPDEEFESLGCNVLAIAPSKCILVSGNPLTASRLD